MADVTEENINVVGNCRMPMLRYLNEKAINIVGGSKGGSE